MSTLAEPTIPERASEPPAFDWAKFRPPRATRTIVGHERLLALRPDPAEHSVVAVVAPAGYGKSTVISEWIEHDRGRVVWVTIDVHDSDPVGLAGSIAASLLASGADAPDLAQALTAPSASIWSRLMPRLSVALHDAGPLTMVLDDVHKIGSAESWDVIDWLMLRVAFEGQLIVAGRSYGGTSMPRLETAGRLVALRADDLALDDDEAYELMQQIGASTDRKGAKRLNGACQGWVSGLLMVAVAECADIPDRQEGHEHDRLVDEYVATEVLGPLSADERDFVMQISTFRLASAALCDAALERSDSALMLERLCAANAFVSRLGTGWCQLHDLVRLALQRRLKADDPDLVVSLRRRAATWHAEHGNLVEAVHYAVDSEDVDLAAGLIGDFAVEVHGSGRVATLRQWLDWLESQGLTARDPMVLTAGTLVAALSGQPERSERWATVLRTAGGARPSSAATEGDAYRACVAAWQCDRGAERMLADATRAIELIGDDSPLRKAALGALGFARLMNGLDEDIEALWYRILEEGGPAWADTNARSLAAAMLAEGALRARDREAAAGLIERAISIRDASLLAEHSPQAIVDAVAARVALLGGAGVDAARRHLAQAQRVRPDLSWAMPSLALWARLQLIKAHLAVADVGGARALGREVTDILHHRPGLGAFEAEADELRVRIAEQAEATQGPSSLTAAELRLVPWLATHLSFREIGERLFLSTNTVKSEALSTYRKLSASSRSEAVEAAVRVGLLDPASLPGILSAGDWSEQPSNHP